MAVHGYPLILSVFHCLRTLCVLCCIGFVCCCLLFKDFAQDLRLFVMFHGSSTFLNNSFNVLFVFVLINYEFHKQNVRRHTKYFVMFMRGVSFGKLTGAVRDTVAQHKTKNDRQRGRVNYYFHARLGRCFKKQLAAN